MYVLIFSIFFFRINYHSEWQVEGDGIQEVEECSLSCLKREIGKGLVKIYLLKLFICLKLMIAIKLCIVYLESIDEQIHNMYARVLDRRQNRRH